LAHTLHQHSKPLNLKSFPTILNAPTFLNVGGDFPNQLLTLVVWGKDRSNFKNAPEEAYKGQEVQVAGKVELHRGKPQMILYHDNQITIKAL
jgi:hypothetical protein